MKTTFPWKQAIGLFVAVLLTYLAVFNGIEWLRHHKGPWRVAFETNSYPLVRVSQSYLNVSAVIEFPDEKASSSGTVAFDKPKKQLPSGKLIYEDLTFLPGVVTFDLFGHEIELLPRVLIVNKKEIPWDHADHLQVWATNKPTTPPNPAKGYE
ncbi:MAG TPA: hypothetical protein VK850_11905 [Candidatus Binatia bacterium]|nr:hypothetical protein [Candidatus Binatia bacterium]